MGRSRGTWLVLAALVLVVLGGGAFLFSRAEQSGAPDAGRGGGGSGGPQLNAKIVGLESPGAPERREDLGTEPRPTRLSPGGTVPVGGGHSARSGGVLAPEAASPACSASLLQSILGLGVTLLGGRPAC